MVSQDAGEKGNMGFSNITSHLLLFIATLLISTGLVIIFKGYIDASSDSLLKQQQFVSNQFETDITIENVGYDNTTAPDIHNITVVDVRNVGSSILDPDRIYAYIDGVWIIKNAGNMSISVLNDTDTVNPGYWDPKELLEIEIYGNLNSTVTHTVKVSTEYGISDSELFSI